MRDNILTVREIQISDANDYTDYWLTSGDDYLIGMGVDLSKMPTREQLQQKLSEIIEAPYNKKSNYCIVWELDEKAIGHSSVFPIIFGEEAYMHLHMWTPEVRRKGLGPEFIKLTLPFYFNNLKIKRLLCEPYALNPAPHKALERAGFKFVKDYITTPGNICFEQPVKQYELTLLDFNKLNEK